MVKPNTNALGKTTVSLSDTDKGALARAHDVCMQIGYFGRETIPVDQAPPSASQIAFGLNALLASHSEATQQQSDADTINTNDTA